MFRYRWRDLFERAKKESAEKGFSSVLAGVLRVVLHECEFLCLLFVEAYYRLARRGRSFELDGEQYHYLYRRYNRTWNNERSVELPIVWNAILRNPGRILEVGNVLSNYFLCKHDVLDKYDGGRRVIKRDVVDYRPRNRYDLIVSISTLEHVGFDPPEEPDAEKIIQALENLCTNCLARNGRILVTLPLGYNLNADRLIREGTSFFTRLYYLKRVSKDNRWVEDDASGVTNSRYAYPFPAANALAVGVIVSSNRNQRVG
jgi:hypothetical protein